MSEEIRMRVSGLCAQVQGDICEQDTLVFIAVI